MGNHVVNATGPKSGAFSATKQRPVLKPRDHQFSTSTEFFGSTPEKKS
jgi:hypothetical protein